jgi:hypothetical protein
MKWFAYAYLAYFGIYFVVRPALYRLGYRVSASPEVKETHRRLASR